MDIQKNGKKSSAFEYKLCLPLFSLSPNMEKKKKATHKIGLNDCK